MEATPQTFEDYGIVLDEEDEYIAPGSEQDNDNDADRDDFDSKLDAITDPPAQEGDDKSEDKTDGEGDADIFQDEKPYEGDWKQLATENNISASTEDEFIERVQINQMVREWSQQDDQVGHNLHLLEKAGDKEKVESYFRERLLPHEDESELEDRMEVAFDDDGKLTTKGEGIVKYVNDNAKGQLQQWVKEANAKAQGEVQSVRQTHEEVKAILKASGYDKSVMGGVYQAITSGRMKQEINDFNGATPAERARKMVNSALWGMESFREKEIERRISEAKKEWQSDRIKSKL